MSVAVAHLLEEALLLPSESRTELVEALLERSEPARDFLDHQLGIVMRRMQSVRDGTSSLIAAEDAHDQVMESLKLRA
jgi:Putative addiction module component